MVETFNEIIKNRSFEKTVPWLLIRDKNFLNEEIRSHDLAGVTFSHLTFLDCNFLEIDFRRTLFISCDFTNCNFTETIFFKSELNNCSLTNSKIFQSDFSEANFIESHFIDCQFDDVDMSGAVGTECEFIKPKFNKLCFLDSVTLFRSKIWDSKKWIEFNAFDNFQDIINELED